MDAEHESSEQEQQSAQSGAPDAPNGGQGQQSQGGAQGDSEGQGDKPVRRAGESDEDWKARSRQWEDRAKQNKRQLDEVLAERDKLRETLDKLAKAIGGDEEEKEDPLTAAEKAAAERDAAKAEARLARVELAAERAARKAGADVDALLDSRSFLDKLSKLDPSDSDFLAEVEEVVKRTLADHPRLKAQSAPSRSATVDMSGGGMPKPSGPSSVEDFRKARRERTNR